MKKLMLSAVLCCGVLASFAQGRFEKHTPSERAQMQTERMAQVLKLSDEQKQTVLKINLATAEQLSKAGADKKELFTTLQQKNEGEFKKILSEEQFRQFETMKKERQEQMKERRELRQKQ